MRRFCCVWRHCRVFIFNTSASCVGNFCESRIDVRTAPSRKHMRPAHDMATTCQPKRWIPFGVVSPCGSNRKEADTAISNQIFGIVAFGCRGLTLGNYRRGGRNCGRRHDMMAERRELPTGSRKGKPLLLIKRSLAPESSTAFLPSW